MDHKSFLGGIWKRGMAPTSTGEEWGWVASATELFLRTGFDSGGNKGNTLRSHLSHSVGCRLFTWDGIALLMRGYARSGGGTMDLNRIADDIYRRYLSTGSLAVDGLDGAFTLALLDSRDERVTLYRNLIGVGFTYYRVTGDGLLFGGNLNELLPLIPEVRPNQGVLPSYYLYRCVPGRETLFDGVYRLLPGEEVTWEPGRFARTQRHTFAHLKTDPVPAREAVERTDATMVAILRDIETFQPGSANLLSGGVDSSYIQAIYNQEVYRGDDLPASYCIAVDHPMTWIDTDYAITASMAIGTRHILTPANDPYQSYLTDALAQTGEPMNHVQSAYFGHLARAMADAGITAGLCGEGADSLFGVGMANKLHNAQVIERLLPWSPLRQLAKGIAGLIGWDSLRRTIDLAGRRFDETSPDHPVNQVASFTDRAMVVRCFGEEAVCEAEAKRRALLDRYEVGSDPLDRLHAAGFLGEAMDSAGLWATLFQRAGVDLLCPFLDSRMLRLALNLPSQVRYTFRRPKAVLKTALAHRTTSEIATRVKLGFGQPIFEWLQPEGQLAALVARIDGHGLPRPELLRESMQRPTWFTYSAMCYGVWHRLFVERSIPRTMDRTPAQLQISGG